MSPALVSVALAALVAIVPVARAFAFAPAVGETKVDRPGACSGGVRNVPQDGQPWQLRSNPDYVYVPYNVSWQDQRDYPAPTRAYHNFTLDAVHLNDPVRHDEVRKETNGGVPQTYQMLAVNVTNVYSGQYVNVTFTAHLDLQGGAYCPVSISVTMHYYFVYP